MKRFIALMSIKTVMLLLSVMFVSQCIDAKNQIYLENQYGAEIVCKVRNGNRTNNNMLINNQETPIGNGVRVHLGTIPVNPNLSREWVNSIEIKASRYFPLSSYISLENYLENIVRQFSACCTMKMNCKEDICNKDVVLVVRPSNIFSGWNISLQWESSRKTIAF